MKKIQMIVFLTIFSTIYLLLHSFVFNHIVIGLNLVSPYYEILLFFFLFAGISYILGEALGKVVVVKPMLYFGAVWMGILTISVGIFFIQFLILKIFSVDSRLITKLSLFVIGVLSITALVNSAYFRRIKILKIKLKNLPEELRGFRIVQLSDVHLGKTTSGKWFDKIVNEVNSLEPDILVITGDLIDEDINHLEEHCSHLKNLKSRLGKFIVPGNHEYYAGYSSLVKLSNDSGLTILRNNSISVNEHISVYGLDEVTARRFDRPGPSLEETLKGIDVDKINVLLSHQPVYFSKAVQAGIDLQLAGHTHAGQIPPITLLVKLMFKYSYGLYKLRDY